MFLYFAGCQLSEEGCDSLWESIWCGSSRHSYCLCKKKNQFLNWLFPHSKKKLVPVLQLSSWQIHVLLLGGYFSLLFQINLPFCIHMTGPLGSVLSQCRTGISGIEADVSCKTPGSVGVWRRTSWYGYLWCKYLPNFKSWIVKHNSFAFHKK